MHSKDDDTSASISLGALSGETATSATVDAVMCSERREPTPVETMREDIGTQVVGMAVVTPPGALEGDIATEAKVDGTMLCEEQTSSSTSPAGLPSSCPPTAPGDEATDAAQRKRSASLVRLEKAIKSRALKAHRDEFVAGDIVTVNGGKHRGKVGVTDSRGTTHAVVVPVKGRGKGKTKGAIGPGHFEEFGISLDLLSRSVPCMGVDLGG